MSHSGLEFRRPEVVKDLVLCLSGGGFRAASFHLGIVRWLYSRGLLPYVDEVRGVSGGSMLAGWMWCNRDRLLSSSLDVTWFDQDFAQPFVDFLSRDQRTVPVAKTLLYNLKDRQKRVKLFSQRLDSLYLAKTSNENGRCRFCFVAFDLDSDEPVVLVASDPSRLSTQVVASAAFPPVIGPVKFEGRRLTDGGLACNFGVSAELMHSARCLIISDGGRGSAVRRPKFAPYWLSAARAVRRGANRSYRDLVLKADPERLLVTVAAIDRRPWLVPYLRQLERPAKYARWRTDLAGFSHRRVSALAMWGEQLADRAIGSDLGEWGLRLQYGDDHLAPRSSGLKSVLQGLSVSYFDCHA